MEGSDGSEVDVSTGVISEAHSEFDLTSCSPAQGVIQATVTVRAPTLEVYEQLLAGVAPALNDISVTDGAGIAATACATPVVVFHGLRASPWPPPPPPPLPWAPSQSPPHNPVPVADDHHDHPDTVGSALTPASDDSTSATASLIIIWLAVCGGLGIVAAVSYRLRDRCTHRPKLDPGSSEFSDRVSLDMSAVDSPGHRPAPPTTVYPANIRNSSNSYRGSIHHSDSHGRVSRGLHRSMRGSLVEAVRRASIGMLSNREFSKLAHPEEVIPVTASRAL